MRHLFRLAAARAGRSGRPLDLAEAAALQAPACVALRPPPLRWRQAKFPGAGVLRRRVAELREEA
eukprot:430752-Pyramimonas_sp.AAC.1